MVLNRLVDPCSKLGLMRWKETVYRPAFAALQLQHFYRALDVLAEHKEAIEDRLLARMRDLFWLKVDLVFWDTTSSYFEGRGPEGLAAYGYSRDKRPDRPQLLIGVPMTQEGYPVAHEAPETWRMGQQPGTPSRPCGGSSSWPTAAWSAARCLRTWRPPGWSTS